MVDSAPNRLTTPRWDEETYALARKIVSRIGFILEEDKEDIIQDFAAKNPTFEKFDGRSKFSTWLRSGLNHQAVDFVRKKDQLRKNPENRLRFESLTSPQEAAEVGKKSTGYRPLDFSEEDKASLLDQISYLTRHISQPQEHGHYTDLALLHFHEEANPYFLDPIPYEDDTGEQERQRLREHLASCPSCSAKYDSIKPTNRGAFRELITEYWRWLVSYSMLYTWHCIAQINDAITAKEEFEQRPDEATQQKFDEKRADAIASLTLLRTQIDNQLAHWNKYERRVSRTAKGHRICGLCGQPGHNARSCRRKNNDLNHK